MKASERLDYYKALQQFCAHARAASGFDWARVESAPFSRFFLELSARHNSDKDALELLCDWYSEEIRALRPPPSPNWAPRSAREVMELYEAPRAWAILLARDHFAGQE